MKNSIRNLVITVALITGIFGIVSAEEVVSEPATVISGEYSTDIIIGKDATTFGTPYTGLSLTGNGWELNTNLLNGDVNVEIANYSWVISESLKATFGSQAEPYGIAWGLHRPSNNSFVSTPRDHSVSTGASISATKWGIGVDAFYGGDITDDTGETSAHWATRVSYGINQFGINSTIGLSVNSDDAQLVDVSTKGSALGIPYESSFEYDLANDGAYWLRGVVIPGFAKGAFGIIGYNSDEEVVYGVGYNCTDNMKIITEFSSEDEDDSGILIRASYRF